MSRFGRPTPRAKSPESKAFIEMAQATLPTLRWALIGAGDVADRHVVPALRATGQTLAALWSPHAERAGAAAHRHCTYVARSREEAIALADIVYVCSPVDTHVTHALTALAMGKHVVVEKPLSAGLEPTRSLPRAVAASGKTLTVAYYRRLLPFIRLMREWISIGRHGTLRAVSIDFSMPYPLANAGWRAQQARSGGGVLADAGCHRLDYLVDLLGIPERWQIDAVAVENIGVESELHLRMWWRGDLRATCTFSWRHGPNDLAVFEFDHARVTWTASEPGTIRVAGAEMAIVGLETPTTPLAPMIEDLLERIALRHPPRVTVEREIAFDDLIAKLLRAARHRDTGSLHHVGACEWR